MADRRRIARASGKMIAGVAGVGIAVLAITTAGHLALPTVEAAVPSIEVTPIAADQTRVCPGALVTLGADGSFSAFATPDVTVATGGAAEAELGGVESPNNSSAATFGSPIVMSVDSTEDADSPLIAGAQSQMAGTGDLSGYTATACGEPAAESWLVAGSTDTGRSSVLSLTNPTESDATVDLEIFSENGAIDAPGSAGIIVQAGEQRLFSLSGFAPNMLTPVVKVTSTGGQVYASMQQSTIRGITPVGVETSSPVSAPSTTQHLTGVVISSDAPALGGGEGYDDNSPVVRLFAPGDVTAHVELTFVKEGGGENPLPLQATLQGGNAFDVSLVGLPPGYYAIEVTSDQPVVAAARTAVDADGIDFAWYGGSAALGEVTAIAVASGPEPSLHLYNPTDSDLEVELRPDDGEATAFALAAGEARAVELSPALGYTLRGATGAHAQVVYRGEGALSGFVVQSAGAGAAPVTVYPR
ncbi:hypothetical protein GCM10027416_05690 [Okibacterium endophyticum]